MGRGLYIGTIIILILLIIIIFKVIYKKRKVNSLEKIINRLEKEKNLLINVPVLNELNKVEALVKNNK